MITENELNVLEVAALPGYKSIIATFDDEISLIEAEMANEEEIVANVKRLVYWQFLKRMVEILRLYPEKLKQALEEESNRSMYDALAQMSVPQASAVLRQVYARKLRDEGTKTVEELTT